MERRLSCRHGAATFLSPTGGLGGTISPPSTLTTGPTHWYGETTPKRGTRLSPPNISDPVHSRIRRAAGVSNLANSRTASRFSSIVQPIALHHFFQRHGPRLPGSKGDQPLLSKVHISPWQKSSRHSTVPASRRTALRFGHILPVCSLIAPCPAGRRNGLGARGTFTTD